MGHTFFFYSYSTIYKPSVRSVVILLFGIGHNTFYCNHNLFHVWWGRRSKSGSLCIKRVAFVYNLHYNVCRIFWQLMEHRPTNSVLKLVVHILQPLKWPKILLGMNLWGRHFLGVRNFADSDSSSGWPSTINDWKMFCLYD